MKRLGFLLIVGFLTMCAVGVAEDVISEGITKATIEEMVWCEDTSEMPERAVEEGVYCPDDPDKEDCCENYSELEYGYCMNTDNYGTCYQIASFTCMDMAWWASREYCDELFIINPEDMFAYMNCIANKEMEYYGQCMSGPEFAGYMLWCMDELESLNHPHCMMQKYSFFNYCMAN